MPSLEVVLDGCTYEAVHVPEGCRTVRQWKQHLASQFLGSKAPSCAASLTCHDEGTGEPLGNDDPLALPRGPVAVGGPLHVLKALKLALARPAELAAVDTWDDVCRAVGASAVHRGGSSLKDAKQFKSENEHTNYLLMTCNLWRHRLPCDPLRKPYLQSGERLGRQVVGEMVGEGVTGSVYWTKDSETSADRAVKFPLTWDEFHVWKALQEQASGCPGLPRLYDYGVVRSLPYAVTDLLGADLRKLLPFFERHTVDRRWPAVKVIGRMLLRRIKAVHACGLVHNDVSPFNILFGRPHGGGTTGITLYLIDFGLARRYPGGGHLGAEYGTTDFNSVRTAAGGERVREDDLEALGWLLIWLMFAGLPWATELDFPDARYVREVCAAKRRLLREGWGVLGGPWRTLKNLPKELDCFMHSVRWDEEMPTGSPDYELLAGLLGARRGLGTEEAEREDIREWLVHVAPLLQSPRR